MNLGKVRIAYPYVEYKINVTHHTERKSTVPEWLLLEIARTAEEYPEYAAIPLDNILSSLFFVADGDALLRKVLLDLIDVQALKYIPGLNDTSDWDQLHCGDLKLTDLGRNLQRQGRLPAKSLENFLSVTYDVANDRLLVDSKKNLLDETDSFKVRNVSTDNPLVFPESLVLERIESARGKSNALNWLQANSQIESVTPVESHVKWQNAIKNITADNDGNISLQDENDPEIIELALQNADFDELPNCNLPTLTLNKLSTKRKVQPYSKIEESLLAAANKSDIFFIAPQFEDLVSAVAVEFHFGHTTRPSAYIYEANGDFEQELLRVVERYYRSELRILELLNFVTNPPYQKFYTEEIFRLKLSASQWEVFTPVDKALEQLLKLDKNAASFMSAPASCTELRRTFLDKGADFLCDVHDWANQWQKALTSLRNQIGFDLNDHFLASMKRAEKITEAISLFFDASGEGYSKIYLMETSALRHYPALLDDFTDNRTMVIVPKETQAELKELTESEDGKDKRNVENARQKITEYRNKRWLNLDEENHEELLAEAEKEFRVLGTAFKYLVKNPVLVTDVAALRDFAISKNIDTITAHELHEKLNGGTVSKGKAKNKGKRKKK